MKKLRCDHSEVLTWLGRDLFGVMLEAWKEQLSDDDIRARVEVLPGFQSLPPAVRECVAHPVRQAIGKIESERGRIAYARRMRRNRPFARPFSDRLLSEFVEELRRATPCLRSGWLSDPEFILVGDDADVGVSVIDESDSVVPRNRHEFRVRAGSLKRVWKPRLAWTCGNCLNLELRPFDARVPFFDAYAAIWVDVTDLRKQRHEGVMLRHRATGAVRHGADLRAALGTPIEFDDAEQFIRQSLEPLEKASKRIRATGCGRNGKVELPIDLAERIRAHLIWIGRQLGGPLEEIFSSTAKKGYMFRPMKRGIDLFTIRSRDRADFRLSYVSPLTSQAKEVGWLPAVPMASTAHERMFAGAFRRGYGDEGLEYQAKATGKFVKH